MTEAGRKALLPDGLRDGLPPDAAHEADIANRLLASFIRYGYQRVTPPLVEFEDTLLGGATESIANSTFRLMDPVSQRMMGVRADMTQQIARIATTRLVNAPRPLRLAYAGQVLRVRGSQLRPEREFLQAGVELIGSAEPASDAETICLAATALQEVGVEDVSVDINLPTLVPSLCSVFGLGDDETRQLRAALDRKDIAAVEAINGPTSKLFATLLDASGPASDVLAALDALDLPPVAIVERNRLSAVVALVQAAQPGIMLTADPVEHRGFEYHTGLSYTLFARGVRGELGSGGRYRAGRTNEPATGFTLFLDSVLRGVPEPSVAARVFLPFGTPPDQAAALRRAGRIAVAGLAPVTDDAAEAARLDCAEIYKGGRIVALDPEKGSTDR
jgi:ATP phosphoribosyltransferase regulatory subunit